jgi:2-polyprenyl-3-methyl-5-hydroxy-6-metoxy-1,4-benzoquinol methylase
VWDSLRNIEKWKAMNRLHAPSHVPLGYVPELSQIKASQAQDIDVLFYGSLNERRTAILIALKNAGLKVHTVFGVYGKQRDEVIARCKVVLNIHFYETRVFEFVRIAYLLANSKAGVSECSSENEMEQVPKAPSQAVADGCREETSVGISKMSGPSRRSTCRNCVDGTLDADFAGTNLTEGFSDMNSYYDGLNEKLYAAIPSARNVLELGCAAGRLGQKYKQSHPKTTWVGVDCNADALELAGQRLDGTFRINLDDDHLDTVGQGYDCVVMGDLLEHLKQPEKILERLAKITTANASLVCCAPNMGHISVLERMLSGDISYDDQGLLDRTHLRFFSCSALFKIFLDSGWLPALHDSYQVGCNNPGLAEKLVEAARLLSVPPATAQRLLFTYQMVVRCKKRSDVVIVGDCTPFSVIVPVNNQAQMQLNILRSPGLTELNPQVLLCQGAESAAAAFNWGAGNASSPWLIYCHQDVYFPKGSGHAIANILSQIPESESSRTILGFAGLGVNQTAGELDLAKAGLVVDRVNLFDYPESSSAVSIDEFAVVLNRNCKYRIDPRLGWHLWATDLCLQAIFDEQQRTHARLLRVPLFHNSLCDGSLPAAFHVSSEVLAAKYPQLGFIPTLCGNIVASASAQPGTPAYAVNPVVPTQAAHLESAWHAAK